MSDSVRLNTLFLGLTAMFVGYFLTWLPGPAAGLQIIGLEMGEGIKFLGVGGGRNWFYLPPIARGAIVALLAAMLPNDDWRTWLARFLATEPTTTTRYRKVMELLDRARARQLAGEKPYEQ